MGPGGTPIDVHLVSHSLGGRVVLELLKYLARNPNTVVVRSLSVMACAVPVKRVADRADLQPAVLVPARTQVLHSTDDLVLRLAFPPGETLGGDGLFPEAVGRFGGPLGAWTSSRRMAGYGHGDYWDSIYAAQLLAQHLGAPIMPPIAAHTIAARALPPTRDLQTATLRERVIGANDLAWLPRG
jgi:hypothetical protein